MLAMESRKRHNLEEPEPLHPKKRALANAFDSPVHLNGNVSSTPTPTADDEPKDQDSLEVRSYTPYLSIFAFYLSRVALAFF